MEKGETEWLGVFKQLNDWLEPTCFNHWQVQNQLKQIGVPTPPIFVNSLDAMRHTLSSSQINLFLLNQQFCLCWKPANSTPHELLPVPKWGDLILGIRWKKENATPVTITGRPHWHHDLQPFELSYPYHVDWNPYYLYTIGPTDLEILWCMSNYNKPRGVTYMDRGNHKEKFIKVLKSITSLKIKS